MGEWQPIETAPKDGTHVLAYGEKHKIVVVFWREGWSRWFTHPAQYHAYVTHWMPLPDEP